MKSRKVQPFPAASFLFRSQFRGSHWVPSDFCFGVDRFIESADEKEIRWSHLALLACLPNKLRNIAPKRLPCLAFLFGVPGESIHVADAGEVSVRFPVREHGRDRGAIFRVSELENMRPRRELLAQPV